MCLFSENVAAVTVSVNVQCKEGRKEEVKKGIKVVMNEKIGTE
jgi:hypothetical protein